MGSNWPPRVYQHVVKSSHGCFNSEITIRGDLMIGPAFSTHISFYIPQSSGNATIMITDINGRNIKSVPVTTTGNGQISLQTAQLAAGTYVYSLYVDGNLIDAKKMVLTK
jgi:hypothetical protein